MMTACFAFAQQLPSVTVTDLNGKQVASVSFSAEEGQPRNLLAEDGKIYVALYSGQVMRLDTASLAKEATVRVGANPEYLVEAQRWFRKLRSTRDFTDIIASVEAINPFRPAASQSKSPTSGS